MEDRLSDRFAWRTGDDVAGTVRMRERNPPCS
jgi:hypothetical protein